MKYSFTLLALSLLFISCDPMQELIIETKGKRNASITIYANKKFLTSDRYYVSHEESGLYKPDSAGKIVFRLPDSLQGSSYLMNFGIGDWQPEEVVDFAENIDSIVFLNSRRRRVLKGEDEIIPYLWRRRRGLPFKNSIYIKAK
jgi:hypothetical protein